MAKTAWESDLSLHIDRSGGEPLSRQIYAAVARAVLDGDLLPGSRLPSARRLSGDLGVARNTVNIAYDQLSAEGYIERIVGSGSRVSNAVHVPSAPATVRPSARQRRPHLSKRGVRIADAALAVGRDELGAPSIGAPALDEFPRRLWRRVLAQQLEHLSIAELGYGTGNGYAPLRAHVAEYLARTRHMGVTASQIIIVAGAQQALDLSARLLIDREDRVLFEEPGYPGARAAFLAAGARLVPVRVDDEGMDIASIPRMKRPARLAYTTPAHQFPLGPTLGLSRRLALLEWAESANAWIVEDDYDGEFRYAGNPLSALSSLDRSGRVIYVGTFSKILSPALRIGFMVLPEALRARVEAVRGYVDRHSALLEQAALAAFMSEGHLARHIVKMRAIYSVRRAAALRAFRMHASDLVDVTVPETGLYVVARFRVGVDDRVAARVARERGLAAMPLSSYYIGGSAASGLLVSFANLRDAPGVVRSAMNAIRKAASSLALV